jgi:predicted secreted protein
MKSVVFFGIVYLLLLPLLAIGCSKSVTTTSPAPIQPVTQDLSKQVIELSLSDFTAVNNIVKDITLTYPGTLTVRLESNGTTGYQWGDTVITDPGLIAQISQNLVGPQDTTMVGSASTDIRVFNTGKAGTSTIKLSYDRAWEGGEKGIYTLTINVTIK